MFQNPNRYKFCAVINLWINWLLLLFCDWSDNKSAYWLVSRHSSLQYDPEGKRVFAITLSVISGCVWITYPAGRWGQRGRHIRQWADSRLQARSARCARRPSAAWSPAASASRARRTARTARRRARTPAAARSGPRPGTSPQNSAFKCQPWGGRHQFGDKSNVSSLYYFSNPFKNTSNNAWK